jgi:hypothetical protein
MALHCISAWPLYWQAHGKAGCMNTDRHLTPGHGPDLARSYGRWCCANTCGAVLPAACNRGVGCGSAEDACKVRGGTRGRQCQRDGCGGVNAKAGACSHAETTSVGGTHHRWWRWWWWWDTCGARQQELMTRSAGAAVPTLAATVWRGIASKLSNRQPASMLCVVYRLAHVQSMHAQSGHTNRSQSAPSGLLSSLPYGLAISSCQSVKR